MDDWLVPTVEEAQRTLNMMMISNFIKPNFSHSVCSSTFWTGVKHITKERPQTDASSEWPTSCCYCFSNHICCLTSSRSPTPSHFLLFIMDQTGLTAMARRHNNLFKWMSCCYSSVHIVNGILDSFKAHENVWFAKIWENAELTEGQKRVAMRAPLISQSVALALKRAEDKKKEQKATKLTAQSSNGPVLQNLWHAHRKEDLEWCYKSKNLS